MIRNRTGLESGQRADLRKRALDVIERALLDVQPARLFEEALEVQDETVEVAGRTYDLSAYDDVYVIGSGKGALGHVEALLDVIEDQITEALVVEKEGQAVESDRACVLEAGHPIPNEASLDAGQAVLRLAERATDDDLVILCITGGTSAMVAAPDGVGLDSLSKVNEQLLAAGAPIEDVNAVRKQLSRVKGGRLVGRLHPATIVSFIVSDEVGGDPWGPTVVDDASADSAIEALKRHRVWDDAPEQVRRELTRRAETPAGRRDFVERAAEVDSTNVVLADAATVCQAAAHHAERMGFESLLLSTRIEGESKEVGVVHAGIAKEIVTSRRPVGSPGAVISGGETTVTVRDDSGEGGPNQEAALGFGFAIDGWQDVVGVFVDTDGTDGPTAVAGGIVDGETVARAAERNLDVTESLRKNDAKGLLQTLNDDIETAPTNTNLMDLRVVLVDVDPER